MRLYTALLCVCISYFASAQCYPDRHSTNLSDAWISCQRTMNPNPSRASGYWILYELEERRAIESIHLWNLNHPDYLSDGVRKMSIDYQAEDGSWRNHMDIEVKKAEASGFYEGEKIHMDNDFVTDKVLLTFTANHGGRCYGFSEIRMGTLPAYSTSTEDIEDSNDITVFPNPFKGKTKVSVTNLSSPSIDYEIIDELGRVVERQTRGTRQNGVQFEISSLQSMPAGVYLLKITDGASSMIKKLYHIN